MSKLTKQKLTFAYYQDKGFELHDQLKKFDFLANGAHFLSKNIEQELKFKTELEKWKEKCQRTGKKISPAAEARATCRLQDKLFKNFTPCEKIVTILRNDYENQNFNGRGKRLLITEIEKLEAVTQIFSLSKENRKNKILLKTMKSMVTKLEELEKIQQELYGPKTVSQKKGKEQGSSSGEKNIKSGRTEKEPKQKTSKTDMFYQREHLFRTGALLKEQDETTLNIAGMDPLEAPQRQSISVY